METPLLNFFEFDLGDYGEKVVISSPQELRNWVGEERRLWDWFRKAGSPHLDLLAEAYNNFFSSAEQHAARWQQELQNPPRLTNVLTGLQDTFRNYFCERKILHSSNADARFVFRLREQRGDVYAAGALAELMDIEMRHMPIRSSFVAGVVEGLLYEREIDWSGNAQREIFDELRSKFTHGIDHLRAELMRLKEQNRLLNVDFSAQLAKSRDELTALADSHVKTIEELKEKATAEFEKVTNTYSQELALRAPVDYWKEKGDEHQTLARSLALKCALAGAVCVIFLWFVAWAFLSGLPPGESPHPWHISILVLATFGVVWTMRIVVRLFLSHVHLATDAAERKIMVQTYLAVIKDVGQFSEKDKQIVLERLFRPAADGVVKDDAAPPGFWELITRAR